MVNEKEHKIFDLEKLVGDISYRQYLNQVNQVSQNHNSFGFQQSKEMQFVSDTPTLMELLKLNSISDFAPVGAGQDNEERNKRKKKRR